MEDSPKMLRRPNRLSLARNPKGADSPTTPCRAAPFADSFNTPPSTRFGHHTNTSHSTPLNQYRRTCFIEESPSQDYDSDSQTLICTQDQRQNIIDVAWKWEDQCCPNVAKTIIKSKPRRGDTLKNKRPPPHLSRKSILRQSPECHQKRGFYKFKEELLHDLKNCGNATDEDSSPLADLELDELQSSFKENENDVIMHNLQVIKKTERKKEESVWVNKALEIKSKSEIEIKRNLPPETAFKINSKTKSSPHPIKPQLQTACESRDPQQKLREHVQKTAGTSKHSVAAETNLLEDSDLDSFLLQCSQKIEDNYQSLNKRKKIDKSDPFGNDSFDDIFLSVPVEEKVPSVPKLRCGSPLVRHNSMPARSPVTRILVRRPSNSFTRHNSMPSNDQKQIAVATKSPGSSKCSSVESITSEKQRCTAKEIERKRQEAIQRREASKLRKVAQCSSASGGLFNSNRVKR